MSERRRKILRISPGLIESFLKEGARGSVAVTDAPEDLKIGDAPEDLKIVGAWWDSDGGSMEILCESESFDLVQECCDPPVLVIMMRQGPIFVEPGSELLKR